MGEEATRGQAQRAGRGRLWDPARLSGFEVPERSMLRDMIARSAHKARIREFTRAGSLVCLRKTSADSRYPAQFVQTQRQMMDSSMSASTAVSSWAQASTNL